MLIYVEGIDKAGKSTFIKKFSQHAGIAYYRKNPPITLSSVDYHNYFKGVGYTILELSGLINFDLIIDRSFISDWVYSNRKIHLYDFTIWHEWELRHFQNNVDVILVYFEVDKPTFIDRITKEVDPFMDVNDYDSFTEMYNLYLNQTNFNFVRIPGSISFDKQLKLFLTKFSHLQLNVYSLSLFPFASIVSIKEKAYKQFPKIGSKNDCSYIPKLTHSPFFLEQDSIIFDHTWIEQCTVRQQKSNSE